MSESEDVVGAVTWLFVPGDRSERFDKAAASGADHVVLDLEDAVAPGAKDTARDAVTAWLAAAGSGWVRINGVDTPWFDRDAKAVLSNGPGLRGVMLPKATAASLARWRDAREETGERLRLIALVESAQGVQDAAVIAADPDVVALALGAIDLALDLETEETFDSLLFARGALVIAARAAGLPGPIDGVSVEVRDSAAVSAAAQRARALGFAGKLCIHPAQLEPVRRAFAPDEATVAWAERVRDALVERGIEWSTPDPAMALAVDGRMVDRPVLLRARRILASVTHPDEF